MSAEVEMSLPLSLNPTPSAPDPAYPTRRRLPTSLGDWMRRVAIATGVSAALCIGGCYGATPFDDGSDSTDDPDGIDAPIGPIDAFQIQPTIPDYPIGGEAPVTWFWECSSTQPEHFDWPLWLGYNEGTLCGDETAWAAYDVFEGRHPRHRVRLDSPRDSVFLTILNPEGGVVAELEPGHVEVEFDVYPGRWVFAANTDDLDHAGEWFGVEIEHVE